MNGAGPPGNADLQQYLAVQCAFAHGVVAVIGAIQRLVRADMQPVRPVEQVFAPGIQQVAVAVEHDHRVLAAIEDIDPVLRVDRHRRDILEGPAGRQFRPVGLHPVGVSAVADDPVLFRHRFLLSRQPPVVRDYRPSQRPVMWRVRYRRPSLRGAARRSNLAPASADRPEVASRSLSSGRRRPTGLARTVRDQGADADDPCCRTACRCTAPSTIISGHGRRRSRS